MVNRLLRPLRRWPAFEAVLTRLAGRVTTWPIDEFDRFVRTPFGGDLSAGAAVHPPEGNVHRPAPPMSIAPATFELRFMKLHAEGRFDDMWEMLAEDAQRAWGGREGFIRDMPRMGDDTELLDVQVLNVKVLETWHDVRHDRRYHNVAQVMLRYRVREQWRDWTLDRQVHLIPAAGGWRTLCYPPKVKSTAQTR
jgi:hypothetical protein